MKSITWIDGNHAMVQLDVDGQPFTIEQDLDDDPAVWAALREALTKREVIFIG
jgi:hypothetical protein